MQIFGEIGVLADDGEKVQCHLCGKWFTTLPLHLIKTHKTEIDKYKEQFGLNRTQPLVSKKHSERLAEIQTARLSQYWGTFDLTELNNSKKGTTLKMRKQGAANVAATNVLESKVESQRSKMQGRTFDNSHKMKISMANRGKTVSEETKAKHSATKKELLKRLYSNPEYRTRFVTRMKEAQAAKRKSD